MNVYVIIRSNAYDGFDAPEDNAYLEKEKAEKACEKLNIRECGHNKKYWYFSVMELNLIS
jgi:hypothetical protein